jgi:hypothetical protein
VAWVRPSSRAIVANEPVTPGPPVTVSPASSVNGGQFVAHCPLHALLPGVSFVKT